jgi:hypothetical protein
MDDEKMNALSMMAEEDSDMDEMEEGLTPRQQALYESYGDIVDIFGMFDKSDGPDGAHYIAGKDNAFKDKGLRCDACSFWQEPNGCEIVSGNIEPDAVCKLWIIGEE